MSGKCFSIETLAEIAASPSDDPRRQHARECPRCGALLDSWREFGDLRDLPAGADFPDARRRIQATLKREIEDQLSPGTGRTKGASGFFRQLGRYFWTPALRPVWGVAAIAVLVIVTQDVWRPGPADRVIRLRDGSGQSVEAPTLLAPHLVSDDEVRLEWRGVPDAGAYRVRVFDTGLAELATWEAGAELWIIVARSALPEPQDLYWQVFALRNGEEVSESQLRPLKLSP